MLKIVNKSRGRILATKARLADTFFSRLVGLLNREKFDDDEALVITHCRSIHMFFMRFPIDAVFIDRNDEVVGLVENLKPYRLSPIFFRADRCIELPAGLVKRTGTEIGDSLEIE